MHQLIEEYRQLHSNPKYFRGSGTLKYRDEIARLIRLTETKTLLDYGCGKGMQYQPPHELDKQWGVTVTGYDPAVDAYAKTLMPGMHFDGVICCDVMEHILEYWVPFVLWDIFARADHFAFFAIGTVPARKHLPSGVNCHVTVRSLRWWIREIEFRNVNDIETVVVEA